MNKDIMRDFTECFVAHPINPTRQTLQENISKEPKAQIHRFYKLESHTNTFQQLLYAPFIRVFKSLKTLFSTCSTVHKGLEMDLFWMQDTVSVSFLLW